MCLGKIICSTTYTVDMGVEYAYSGITRAVRFVLLVTFGGYYEKNEALCSDFTLVVFSEF